MINRRAITITLAIANLCLFVIYLSAWTRPLAQNNKKKVVRPFTLMKEPLEIAIDYRGQPVKQNEEFEGDNDWLRHLKLKLKNRSQKAVRYIILNLTFPETRTAGNSRVALYQIRLGRSPDVESNRLPLYLAPGDSLEINLDTEYSELKNLVEPRIQIENVRNLEVRLDTALFDDNTKWKAGILYRRNPNPDDPHKWIPIDR